MKRWISIPTAILILFTSMTTTVADQVPIPPKGASLLETLNYYRLSSGLAPVVEDAQMTDGAQKHANYLAKTDTSFYVGEYENLHKENPASPYFSTEGTEFGAGNLTWSYGPFDNPIDGLMTAPFHAIGFLREGLAKVGFGTAVVQKNGYSPGSRVTNVAIISGTQSVERTKILLFPGNNSTVYINDFAAENPEPRETCGSDYKSFTGLPIFASLLDAPMDNLTASIRTPEGKVLSDKSDLCVVSEKTFKSSDSIYGPAGSAIIAGDHLVILIPRKPLSIGAYDVMIKQPSQPDLSWRFTYADALPKFENTVTVTYPRSNKIVYVGENVSFELFSIEGKVSTLVSGSAFCSAYWRSSTLMVSGKKPGSCKVNISSSASKRILAMKRTWTISFQNRKK